VSEKTVFILYYYNRYVASALHGMPNTYHWYTHCACPWGMARLSQAELSWPPESLVVSGISSQSVF